MCCELIGAFERRSRLLSRLETPSDAPEASKMKKEGVKLNWINKNRTEVSCSCKARLEAEISESRGSYIETVSLCNK